MSAVEDVFSSDVFRRVVLPGIVLTAGFHPLISGSLPAVDRLYGIGAGAVLIGEIIVYGLAVSSAIQWIYYVYEGFRLQWLTALAGQLTRARLQRAQEQMRQIYGEAEFDKLEAAKQAEVATLYEYLLDFPLAVDRQSGSSWHFAERPTRLGNIIATYELYAESRYGIDGTFFWYHLLNLSDDGPRKTFEDGYSFAESLVLASFAGAVVAVTHVIVLLGFAVSALSPSFGIFRPASPPIVSAWLVVFGLVVWYWFYLVSLPAHRQAGAILRAIVDGAVPKFVEWTATIEAPPSDERIRKTEALNEYLKNLERPSPTTRSPVGRASHHRRSRRRR